MPLARIARRAGALLLTAVGLLPISGTAHADTAATYSAVVFPDQSHSLVYDFINSATTSVDVTMYELRDTSAVNALIGRQRAGVQVRVILDGKHTSVNGAAFSALRSAGAGVTYSSSAYVYTHQKTVTVDGVKSLVMTGNLDANYYATGRDFGVFDTDANDVAAIEQVFAADYAKTAITPSDGDNLVWSPTDSESRLLALINGAQTSLDLEQLEFGDQALVDAVAAAAGRGVTVRVVGMNPSYYGTYFDQVTAAGGRIVTYSTTTSLYIHAKTIVADYGTSSAKVFAGSENFSDNSLNNNRELGLITTDAGVLSTLESTFATDFANGLPY
ncbi:phosphatidylserine/phosphatidylglycerophosphate/cardiolipin synthase family protein [Kitasatospora aureofaciens]|uniref:phospholipase D-like domain-containing protein n=1 Tax=Kitasatospora aureofaciens TaxID=1894 RepID=UPI001C45E028|nr:phospholipase D-like domain-containing protein [Kitasatospora aureofaciens]MBV6701884.1 cardiolipin synthase [Kitasatospora aureofaciens]